MSAARPRPLRAGADARPAPGSEWGTMSARTVVLAIVLVFIVGFGYLTLSAIASGGFDVLSAISLLIIALFAFGAVGALLRPPS